MSAPPVKEGLGFARLMMVLSSFTPLFILWAIRGEKPSNPSVYFTWFCIGMILLPNCFLFLRYRSAIKHDDFRTLAVGKADDHRDQIIVYLFAMLMPFYSVDNTQERYLASTIAALAFIIFLFWHLNLHYLNVVFALFGYRVYTIYPPDDKNPITGKHKMVLITRRTTLDEMPQVRAYRLSNTVYLEAKL